MGCDPGGDLRKEIALKHPNNEYTTSTEMFNTRRVLWGSFGYFCLPWPNTCTPAALTPTFTLKTPKGARPFTQLAAKATSRDGVGEAQMLVACQEGYLHVAQVSR